VDQTGLVTFTGKEGNVVVTLTSAADPTKTASGGIQGPPPAPVNVESVAISGAPATYDYDLNASSKTLQLAGAVTPSNADNTGVAWNAAGPATVDQTGLVTFTGKEGNVVVTLTSAADPTKTDSVTIAVRTKVSTVATPWPSKKLNMTKGKSLSLAKFIVLYDNDKKTVVKSALTYKSSKKGVATISKSGKITAKKAGSTNITATTANGKKITFKLTVAKKASKFKSFKVTGWTSSISKNKTKQIKLKFTPASATNVTKIQFKSSKPSVLTVDAAGKLVAKKKGKATITVTVGSKKVTKKITVK
jgi:uncharacterized protein YjdB